MSDKGTLFLYFIFSKMHGIPVTKFQTFREGEGSYRYLKFPLPKQQLQLLYPGRLMSNQWHYTGENIPNEDPTGLAETQSHMSALQRAAAIEEEALERHLGGKHKIARHPFVTPESSIEDPDLKSVSILDSANPNLQKVPGNLPSMKTIESRGEQMSKNSEAESHRAEDVARLVKETGLPARDIREGFQYPQCKTCAPRVHPFPPRRPVHDAHPPDFVTPVHAPPYYRESFELEESTSEEEIKKMEQEIKDLENDLKKNHLWLWLALGGSALLLIIIIVLIIYLTMRKKK